MSYPEFINTDSNLYACSQQEPVSKNRTSSSSKDRVSYLNTDKRKSKLMFILVLISLLLLTVIFGVLFWCALDLS